MVCPDGKYFGQSESVHSGTSGDSPASQTQRANESSGNDGSQSQAAVTQPVRQAAEPSQTYSTSSMPQDASRDKDVQDVTPETEDDTYEAFFGMREPPFALTPNPAFFFVNERGREGAKQIE